MVQSCFYCCYTGQHGKPIVHTALMHKKLCQEQFFAQYFALQHVASLTNLQCEMTNILQINACDMFITNLLHNNLLYNMECCNCNKCLNQARWSSLKLIKYKMQPRVSWQPVNWVLKWLLCKKLSCGKCKKIWQTNGATAGQKISIASWPL